MSNIHTDTHGEAEVFVLPPDLLEKLGINLCNITQTVQQSHQPKKEKNEPCIKSNASFSNHEGILNNVSNSQETSILETANLMKKSLFLSPTFVSMVGDAIPGEVEISKNVDQPVDSNTTKTNKESNTKNKYSNQENVNFELQQDSQKDKQAKSRISKETDQSVICNTNGRNYTQGQLAITNGIEKSKQNFSHGIINTNLDEVKSKLKTKCLKARDVHKLTTLNNSVQLFDISQENLQTSKHECQTNSENINHGTKNSNNINKNRCVIPISTLNNHDIRLRTEEGSLIPVFINSNVERGLDSNGLADNDVIDDHQSLIVQDVPQKNDPLDISVTPVLNDNQSTEDSVNSINVDVTRYSGCNESVDMELNNMVHKTEVLIPVLSSTNSTNMNCKDDEIHVVDDLIKKSSHTNFHHEKEPHSSVEGNDILMSISPELRNVSNISQNIGNTQDINIDILYESFDEQNISNKIETSNINQHQKPMIPISVTCESEQDNQCNGLDLDIINHIECDETSDMELDNMLRETEILISSSLLSSQEGNERIYDGDKELRIEKEINDVFKGNEILSSISELNSFGINKENNNSLLHLLQIKETKGKNIIINYNGSINKKTSNAPVNFSNVIQNVISDSDTFNFDYISSPATLVEKNINFENNTVELLECTHNDNLNLKSTERDSNINNVHVHKFRKSIEDAVQNNNCIYGTDANKMQMKDMEDLSNIANVTKTTKNELGDNTFSNYKQVEINDIHKSPSKLTSNNQLKKLPSQTHIDYAPSTEEINNLDLFCNGLQLENMEPVIEEKVQEIAKYLKQVYQNKSGIKSKVGGHTKSKIFIQGVEKPGGSGGHELVFNKLKPHKTFEKKKKQIKFNVPSIIKQISYKTGVTPEENSTQINACIEPSHLTKRQEFCLCDDFGKIRYDDEYNNLYEHVHYGSNISVNCPIDTVYEIYYDKNSFIDFESRELVIEKDNFYECDSGHICWQKIEYQDDKNVSKPMKFNENAEAAGNKKSETGVSLKIPNSVLILADTETKSNPKFVNMVDKNNDKEVTNEIKERFTTELMSEENAFASQLDTESKEKENNMLLDQSDKNSKISTMDEIKRNTSDHGINTNEVIMEPALDISATIQKSSGNIKSRKRKIKNDLEEPPAKKNVKCGVCELMFSGLEWEDHISKVHYYVAWKDGDTFDFENVLFLSKIKKKLTSKGSLICTFCGFEYVKLPKFLTHVKKCFSKKVSTFNIDSKERMEVATTSKSRIRHKCGVCQLAVRDEKWIEHISKQHQYLAWKDGEPPLDTGDENKVMDHLLNLVKKHDHLICAKCGLLRKYTAKSIKNYMAHIQKCTINKINETRTSRRLIKSEQSTDESPSTGPSVYKCAVCEKDVDASDWSDHVSKQHNYRAWKDGEPAPNFEDESILWEHLNEISKKEGGLRCSNCGVVRKYVKPYLQHIRSCTAKENETEGEVTTGKDKKSQANAVSSDKLSPRVNKKKSQPNVSSISEMINKDTSSPSTSKDDNKIDVLNSDIGNISDEKSKNLHTDVPSSDLPNSFTCSCGVCGITVEESKWIDHIRTEHNYIAHKAGEAPLNADDKNAIWQHLSNIVTTVGKLICGKCGKERKYPKSFLHHIEDCPGPDTSSNDTMNESMNYSVVTQVDRYLKSKNLDTSVTELKCGVCHEISGRDAWIAHIQIAHNYIAWIDGETPLDTNNEDMIREHLQKIVDEIGALVCAKCGTSRKYAKAFMSHVHQCSGENELKHNKSGNTTSSDQLKADETATCGACMQKIQINHWITHIRITHNYLAWKEHQAHINAHNRAQVEKRLRAMVDKIRELICPKCGYKSKEVELYLQHSESCKGNPDYELEDTEVTELAQKGSYQCAMCQEKIKYGEWKSHAVDKHYNVAWVVGDEPIDLRNQNEITKILKEYLKYGSYVCKVCGITRSSGTGFYAHFVTCGLSEEESDKYKSVCDVCGSKYIGIYKSQHMALHTQKEMAIRRREKADEDRRRERARRLEELGPVSGRRRAAEKARMVIEETVRQFKHVCQSCSFATDVEEEMSAHKCPKGRKMSDDLDLSLQKDESSDDADLDDEIDESDDDAENDIEEDSDEDDDSRSRKRKHNDNPSASARITRIPFVIPNVLDYLSKNVKDYTDHYLTTDTLFPQWTQCNYKVVPERELLECLPPLEESCQVYSNENWQTYKRWQADVDNQKTTVFAGYSIQKISWLPSHIAVPEHNDHNYLAVACHAGVDCPRLNVDDVPEYPTLTQIWDFENFKKAEPKLVLGLVIPFGTVWAIDWCPSGARECLDEAKEGFVRMGLLAVACSNGMAYIFSVPYPSTVVTSDSVFIKLEPVALLRFTMKSDRPKYQATSVCWSKQKGHSTIVVGYSDGSTAYYDLNTESPFLKANQDNITVFYPFFDERVHSGCVTDLSSFPMAHRNSVVGAVSVTSPTGSAVVSAGASGRCARLRSHLASSSAMFLPAWPAVFLAGEDVITNLSPNELEYWGFGRRAGPAQTCGGCAHCGVVASYMAPYLRLLRTHHARADLKKMTVAWIGAKQLGKKRKHNEDKKDIAEALTYEDVVVKYGIEFKLVSKSTAGDTLKTSISHCKEVKPERFPLSDVSSMAFCPSPKHHKRLAVATHAGIIFVINV